MKKFVLLALFCAFFSKLNAQPINEDELFSHLVKVSSRIRTLGDGNNTKVSIDTFPRSLNWGWNWKTFDDKHESTFKHGKLRLQYVHTGVKCCTGHDQYTAYWGKKMIGTIVYSVNCHGGGCAPDTSTSKEVFFIPVKK